MTVSIPAKSASVISGRSEKLNKRKWYRRKIAHILLGRSEVHRQPSESNQSVTSPGGEDALFKVTEVHDGKTHSDLYGEEHVKRHTEKPHIEERDVLE